VQIAVDTQHDLIVAHEVTNVGTDRHQLANIAGQARAEMAVETLDVVADRGYPEGEEIKGCEDADITVTLPKPMTSVPRLLAASEIRTSSMLPPTMFIAVPPVVSDGSRRQAGRSEIDAQRSAALFAVYANSQPANRPRPKDSATKTIFLASFIPTDKLIAFTRPGKVDPLVMDLISSRFSYSNKTAPIGTTHHGAPARASSDALSSTL